MMKITEKALLDGYVGAEGFELVSVVGGAKIRWAYRTGRTSDGYNCVCSRDYAREITLECDRSGKIAISDKMQNHPAVARIVSDEAKMWGDEV